MEQRVLQRKVLITGGGSGIGRGIAEAFQQAGMTVAILGRSSKVRETAAALGKGVFPYEADVRSATEVERAMKQMEGEIGPADILVNNAGVSRLCRFMDLTEDVLAFHYGTNVLGAVHCARAVLPHMMKQRWGRIINMSSVTGPFVADPGDSAYALTKAALIGLTKSLAVELAPYAITVNAICPGYIRSDMIRHTADRSRPDQSAEVLAAIAAGVPLKRLGTPQEVGQLAVYLAGAAYMTGQALILDGGNSIPETTVMGLRSQE